MTDLTGAIAELEEIFAIGETARGKLTPQQLGLYWGFWGERDPLEREDIATAIIEWLKAKAETP